jgi:hypothetical protein
VTVRLPGTASFRPLTASVDIPLGSDIDARRGSVTLTFALPGGGTQSATISGGEFVVSQAANGTVTFRLSQPLTGCRARTAATPTHRRGATKRHITVKENGGSFDTVGQYVSGSVEGTTWITTDGCDYSQIRVIAGVVRVTDLVNHTTVTVTTGHSRTVRRPG